MNTLKTSFYTIPIKLETKEDKYFLVHGYTGAIDIVSKEIFNHIKNISISSNYLTNEMIDLLKRRGYITYKTKEEEVDYVSRISSILHKRNELLIRKDFTFVVSYDCNFSCPYCFEKAIIKKLANKKLATINKEMVDRAFHVIQEIEPNSRLRNPVIQLFGGEPLLKHNRSIIEYIVKKGEKANFSFVATSNGYDLDAFGDVLHKKLIKGVQVTIDGTKLIHDQRRIHSKYIHTFDKIINNIAHALNNGIAIRVRINVDHQNINEIPKLNTLFEELGFYSFKHFSVNTEFIGGECNFNPTDYLQSNISRESFLRVLKSVKNDKMEYDTRLYSMINNAICNKTSITLSSVHCTAQSSSFILDPFGHIYSCLEAVGKESEKIGSYSNGLEWNEGKKKWFNRNISLIKKCSKCKFALLCGGGCFAKVLSSNYLGSSCDDFPIRFKSILNKIYSQLI